MKLYLQFGYGMMAHVKHMFKQWGGGTVILSMRDMEEEQISTLATDLKAINGQTLLDTQLYQPRSSNHHGLQKHDYFQDFCGDNYTTNLLSDDEKMKELFTSLKRLNDLAQTEKYIVPGLYCEASIDSWNMAQKSFLRAAKKFFIDKKMLATLCISSSLLSGKVNHIEQIIELAKTWNVDGFYVVPEGEYLEKNPTWFANLLSLVAGLKLLDKEVIVGYSNHQMLALACTKIDAIATGTWVNVRHFSLKRFEEPSSTGGKRVPWYYCPCSQSEYKLATLDAFKRLAEGRGETIQDLKTDISMNSHYIDSYFDNDIEFKEQAAFRHYFQCMYKQSQIVSKESYADTYKALFNLQNNAEETINALYAKGLRQSERSYKNIGEACSAALEIFNQEKGILMQRLWAKLN